MSWSAKGAPYKVNGKRGYNMMDGDSSSMFLQKDNMFHLVNITAFADASYQVAGEGIFTAQEITDMVDKKLLICAPPPDVPVRIMDLGTIEIDNVFWAAEPFEKLKELLDIPNKFAKKGTVHERCRAAYHRYLEWPSEAAREWLRKTYEAVPEHERGYLGDMDSKDWDYRRILFEPHNKREV